VYSVPSVFSLRRHRPPDNPAALDISVDLRLLWLPELNTVSTTQGSCVAQSIAWPPSASRPKSKEPGSSVDSAVGC
ncbi:hypothetical protein GCK32_001527, partial [Trichostrongylus colubriformis]